MRKSLTAQVRVTFDTDNPDLLIGEKLKELINESVNKLDIVKVKTCEVIQIVEAKQGYIREPYKPKQKKP